MIELRREEPEQQMAELHTTANMLQQHGSKKIFPTYVQSTKRLLELPTARGDPDIGEYSRLPGGSFRFLVGRSMKSPSPESAKPGNDVVRIACLWRDMNVMDLSSPFARSEQN